MDVLTVPKLRNHELQTVTKDLLNICNGLTKLKEPLDIVSEIFDRFKGGMTKEKASASSKKELDNTRDVFTSSFVKAVMAEQYYPHTEKEIIEALQAVRKVVDKYGGSKVNRLSYNEQSAALNNMLSDLKKTNLTPLTPTGLLRWIPLMEEANTNFTNAVAGYIKETADTLDVEAASYVAPKLHHALEELFIKLQAYLVIEPNQELKDAYDQIVVLLNSYR